MARSGPELDVVTGAFSYSGAAIAHRLLDHGRSVRTLTNHPERAPRDTSIEVRPLDFDDRAALTGALTGVTTLYNTYWVRFAYRGRDHEGAVANSRRLFQAAADAGVRRIVHVSITHPDVNSPFPYFRGKALVEQALADTGLSHAILRPAILFGDSAVLINNIAWLLRHLPVFAIGDRGDYRIRAIHVDDLARLSVEQADRGQDIVLDAVGPDRPSFTELITHIRSCVGSRSLVAHVPGSVLPAFGSALGLVLHDKLLTRDEYRAMAAGLADTDGPATGSTSLLRWIEQHSDELGRSYAHEIRRHYMATAPARPQG